jgi:hypothetical protein
MSFSMNSLVRCDKVTTGYVVISTGELDSHVFVANSDGKALNFQPLDSRYFGDGDDDLRIHMELRDKWRDD